MPTDFKERFGPTNNLVLTLDGLTNGSYRSSSGIFNASGYTDLQVSFRITSAGASTDSNGYIEFYAAGSTNKGAYYTDGVTGQDASFTPKASAQNLFKLGYGAMVANSTVYDYGPFSVAAAFDSALPEYIAIVVGNKSGATLPTPAGSGWFAGISYQGV